MEAFSLDVESDPVDWALHHQRTSEQRKKRLLWIAWGLAAAVIVALLFMVLFLYPGGSALPPALARAWRCLGPPLSSSLMTPLTPTARR